MQIQVALVPSTWGEERRSVSIVVIDVLRAATSIVEALAHGARRVMPVASVEEARIRHSEFPAGEVLLCGEREGRRIDGFDLGNSPVEYASDRIKNKTLIFASTNGSKMLARAGERISRMSEKGQVFMAGFVNMGAVVHRLQTQDRDCLIACSGRDGGFSLEDAACAGMIIDGLRPSNPALDDEAKTAQILYAHYSGSIESMIRDSFHGRYLQSIGMGEDLPVCASIDRFDIVPVLQNGYLTA
jgi:2-phosphosulfolactate phosphatase